MIPDNKHIADSNNNPSPETEKDKETPVKRGSGIKRTLRIFLYSLGGLLLFIVLAVTAATWWLTPERLSEIVNREASENLYADVKAHNIRFTLWSSWPHLCVEYDSVTVRSRVFDSISESLKASLPKNADFLASTGKFRGEINLLYLLKGKISLHDVEVGGLRLNLVALNDTLSNFNIVPPDTVKSRIPYFTADKVKLINPGIINYLSLPDTAAAEVKLNTLSLTRLDKEGRHNVKDSYKLSIFGNVNGKVDQLTILRDFPFELAGDINLGFDPFRFSTSNYDVNLGTVKGRIDMNMQVGGDSKLNDFKWHLDNFDLLRLLSYMPGVQLPSAGSFKAPLNVNMTARLTSPWRLSSTVLPSAEVDFDIVDGDMIYTMDNGRTITMRHEGAAGRLIFDGENPEESAFIVEPFHIEGEGVDIKAGASIARVLGEPLVESSVEGKANLKKFAHLFPFLKGASFDGEAVALANVSCRLAPLSQISVSPDPVKDIEAQGKVALYNFSSSLPQYDIKAEGKSLEVDFASSDESLSASSLLNKNLPLLLKGKDLSLSLNGKTTRLAMDDINLKGSLPIGFLAGSPNESESMAADMTASALHLSSGNTTMTLNNLALKFMGKGLSSISADAATSDIHLLSGKDKLTLNDISLKFAAQKMSKPIKTANYKMPSAWTADKEYTTYIPHSSQFLQVKLPKNIKDIMAQWRSGVQLKVRSGIISTPDFPAANRISNLDLAASFDSIVVRNISLRSRSSAMSMRGRIANLRQFLNSSTPAPLVVDMDVAIDTIQVNQLAGTYMRGLKKKGKEGALSPEEKAEIAASDTVAMLLPRNILANIRLRAKQSQYLDLRLDDIRGGLRMKNGDLHIEDLRISADFGEAFLNLFFNTSNIESIGMSGDLGLTDINIVGFFKNFHTLLLMMPQMKNLQGQISAEAQFNLLSFPNMYVNIPSVTADIRVQGDGLTVHQSPFIRHITRMLLIRQDGDLHIADMNVHASLHDNLLELYPFDFDMEKYRLRMGGLNNFNGDLYYHIGVEKSPIPFPFGINILGNISKPKIRFGGAKWKVKKGEVITASVMEQHLLNIKKEGRKFLKEFIRKAAEADQ